MPRRPPVRAEARFPEPGELSLVSGEISLDDFAFADTVMVADLALLQPVRGFPENPTLRPTTIAWNGDVPARRGSGLRGQLWSYEWKPGDLLHAVWIALAMLVLVATLATVALAR